MSPAVSQPEKDLYENGTTLSDVLAAGLGSKVFGKLDLGSRVVCSMVCKSWRSNVKDKALYEGKWISPRHTNWVESSGNVAAALAYLMLRPVLPCAPVNERLVGMYARHRIDHLSNATSVRSPAHVPWAQAWRLSMAKAPSAWAAEVKCGCIHQDLQMLSPRPAGLHGPASETPTVHMTQSRQLAELDAEMLGCQFPCNCAAGASWSSGSAPPMPLITGTDYTEVLRVVDLAAYLPHDCDRLPPSLLLLASAYCWALREGQGMLLLLLDDDRDPIPQYHSGAVFPYNRRGTVASHAFVVPSKQAAEIHMLADVDLRKTKRITVLLRGKRAGHAPPLSKSDPAYQAAQDAVQGSADGLIMGSVGLRWVPNAYRQCVPEAAVKGSF